MVSPSKSNGDRNTFYDNMAETRPGDVVFSFYGTLIKALGVVTAAAVTADKPAEFRSVENPWNREGWRVEVAFAKLADPIRPKDHIDRIRPTLPKKYSHFRKTGTASKRSTWRACLAIWRTC